MRKKIGLVVVLCAMLSWMGCPAPANYAGYEGPWLVMFDWNCNNMGGESIFTLHGDGTLDMADLSLDYHKNNGIVKDCTSSGVDPIEALLGEVPSEDLAKYRFEGTWHVDEDTGQLVMVVSGFKTVRYYVTSQLGNILFGDMYVGDFYNGCFQMQRQR